MEGTGQREEYVYQPYSLTSLLPVSPSENPRGSQRMKELIEIVHTEVTPLGQRIGWK